MGLQHQLAGVTPVTRNAKNNAKVVTRDATADVTADITLLRRIEALEDAMARTINLMGDLKKLVEGPSVIDRLSIIDTKPDASEGKVNLARSNAERQRRYRARLKDKAS